MSSLTKTRSSTAFTIDLDNSSTKSSSASLQESFSSYRNDKLVSAVLPSTICHLYLTVLKNLNNNLMLSGKTGTVLLLLFVLFFSIEKITKK